MPAINEAKSPRSDMSAHAALPQPKRTRYTPIACDECKRRKVKCDGRVPCYRCARHPANCVYTQRGGDACPRPEAYEWSKMNEKLSKLQEQVDLLVSSNVSLSRSHASSTLASTSPADQSNGLAPAGCHEGTLDVPHTDERRRSGLTQQPQYAGPTSTAFSLGVAKTSLQEMGIQIGSDPTGRATTSNFTTPARTPPQADDPFSAQDPLCKISLDEASRLVGIYEEEVGTVYPFIDIKAVLTTAQQFYKSPPAHRTHSIVQRSGDENTLSGGVLDILKLVITIASVLEGHGPTVLSRSLLESVEHGFKGRLCGPSVDVLEIQAWTLMLISKSMLQFHCDEEALAWRTIGMAARAAVELGLHRRDTYLSKFTDPEQRPWANKLFWCIYVLDRRWSFGTGLPFALHDDDIDPGLPEQDDPTSPLLKTMIAYGQLGSKVWKATAHLTSGADDNTLAFLDFQVSQWQGSIAPDLQLHPYSDDMLEGYSRTRNRLRVLLYLRANQMRLLIFRRVLLSPKTISDNNAEAWKAVDVARDTIRLLDRLNRISDIYSSQQTPFNYFLVSALAVVLLAVCHATTQFNESCRGEFYLALDLVRGFSGRSHVARRLWKTVKHLKIIGPKLGVFPALEQPRDNQDRAHQGIASHPTSMSELTAPLTHVDLQFEYHQPVDMNFASAPSSDCSFPLDGIQLSNELTNLFETIDPSYVQPLVNEPGTQDVFNLYTYEPTEGFSRSLLGLL